MAIIHHKPVTPSTRFYTRNKAEVTDKRPERSLTKGHHRKKGRNSYGRITSRRRGGGHKRLYRTIDFRRQIIDVRLRSKLLNMIQTDHPTSLFSNTKMEL